jgi:hypothetical protein
MKLIKSLHFQSTFLLTMSLDLNGLKNDSYSVFHRFGQTKFVNIVLILSPSQISLLPYLCQKMKPVSKVVKTDTKIIILLPKI